MKGLPGQDPWFRSIRLGGLAGFLSVLEQGLLCPMETCVVLTVAEGALPSTRWDRLLPVPEKASSLWNYFLFHYRPKQKSLKWLIRSCFSITGDLISPGRNLSWSWYRTSVRENLSSVMWSESHLTPVTISYLLPAAPHLFVFRFSSHNVVSPLICPLPGHVWPPFSQLMLSFHFRLRYTQKWRFNYNWLPAFYFWLILTPTLKLGS